MRFQGLLRRRKQGMVRFVRRRSHGDGHDRAPPTSIWQTAGNWSIMRLVTGNILRLRDSSGILSGCRDHICFQWLSKGLRWFRDGSGMVLVLAFRNQALGFGNAIPIGFGSGLQGGRNRNQAPRSLPEGLRQAQDLHIRPLPFLPVRASGSRCGVANPSGKSRPLSGAA